jgi:Flp pilus assembly pilin Flp
MTRSESAKKRLPRDESGTTAVEFAIIAPLLFTFLLGIFALGMAYYEGATIQWSLERALRTAMVYPDTTADDIQEAMAEELQLIGSPDVDFSYEVDESGTIPLAVVRADYDVPVKVPFLPDMALHFAAENVAPIPAEEEN